MLPLKISAALSALSLLLAIVPGRAEPIGVAKQLIEHYQMEKIPVEGAWFKVTYTSTDHLAAAALPARYGAPRTIGGAIYALVTREDFSALHRLKTDETWHFYAGDPMQLLLLYPDGRAESVILGPDPLAGQHPQFTVPHGTWMGALPAKETAGAYGFFGTTMAPGFDPADFEPGYREELSAQYPAFQALIAQLTRTDYVRRKP